MSAKKNIFPKSSGEAQRAAAPSDDLDDMYTGHPGYDGQIFGPEDEQDRGAARKGHAAYAAQDNLDEMPPQKPRGKGFGGLGGLFAGADDQRREAGAPHSPQAPVSEEELLAALSHDALDKVCRERICPLCPTKKEADDERLRALADLDNAKKRLERERAEQVRFAAEAVLNDIIPSLDNLDLALQHAEQTNACKDFVIGVRMTRKLLEEALAKHGLERVGECGQVFDPAIHEAMGMVKDPNVPDNHVCALLANGYTLHDRLLRPAKVLVCKNS